jgi:cytochrome c556
MLSMRRGLWAGLLALAVGCGAVGVVTAADDPAATIAARRDLMKTRGKEMGIINDFVQNKKGSAANVVAAAKAMEESAAKLPGLFPKGTGLDDFPGKTGAKPVIWEKWDDFQKASDYFGAEAKELAEVAETGDAAKIAEHFEEVGKACGECHTTFRQKLN